MQFGLQLVGLKLAETPEGRFDAEKLTDWLVPEVKAKETVVTTALPWMTFPEVGLSAIEKSKLGATLKLA